MPAFRLDPKDEKTKSVWRPPGLITSADPRFGLAGRFKK